jgi:predicted methyltransferase
MPTRDHLNMIEGYFMKVMLCATALAIDVVLSSMSMAGPTDVPPAVSRAVADPSRAKAQVDTDVDRKPAETLAFAGVKPGMAIGEMFPGGGYFTQLLSGVVGPTGHVYGIENPGWKGAVKADQDLIAEKKLANVSVVGLPFGTVSFAKPLDLVWVTQNYHDLKIAKYGNADTAVFNRAVFAALKPGGTYFILDHEAPQGTDLAAIEKLHRIEKAQVVKEVTAAGFVLVAESQILHRPDDDHTLPIFDKRVQGHTDQYALKFQKPS